MPCRRGALPETSLRCATRQCMSRACQASWSRMFPPILSHLRRASHASRSRPQTSPRRESQVPPCPGLKFALLLMQSATNVGQSHMHAQTTIWMDSFNQIKRDDVHLLQACMYEGRHTNMTHTHIHTHTHTHVQWLSAPLPTVSSTSRCVCSSSPSFTRRRTSCKSSTPEASLPPAPRCPCSPTAATSRCAPFRARIAAAKVAAHCIHSRVHFALEQTVSACLIRRANLPTHLPASMAGSASAGQDPGVRARTRSRDRRAQLGRAAWQLRVYPRSAGHTSDGTCEYYGSVVG
jgi:hypothetical protein